MAPSATTTFQEYESLSLKTCDSPVKQFQIEKPGNNGERISKNLIGDALMARVGNVNEDTCEAGEEDAFFVADLGDVYRQHLRWKKHLKRVTPHYGGLQQ